MLLTYIIDAVLWSFIVLIAVLWYRESKEEKRIVERPLMIYKDGVGVYGHRPGHYSEIM